MTSLIRTLGSLDIGGGETMSRMTCTVHELDIQELELYEEERRAWG